MNFEEIQVFVLHISIGEQNISERTLLISSIRVSVFIIHDLKHIYY